MNDLTDEQLRLIDAAVAECMGYEWVTADGVRILTSPDALNTLKSWLPASGDEPLAEGDWAAMVPRFATDPVANAQLWDWLISHGWYVALKYLNSELTQVHQAAVFRFKPNVVYSEDERGNRYLALCMAFLLAMGKDVNEILKEAQYGQSE